MLCQNLWSQKLSTSDDLVLWVKSHVARIKYVTKTWCSCNSNRNILFLIYLLMYLCFVHLVIFRVRRWFVTSSENCFLPIDVRQGVVLDSSQHILLSQKSHPYDVNRTNIGKHYYSRHIAEIKRDFYPKAMNWY